MAFYFFFSRRLQAYELIVSSGSASGVGQSVTLVHSYPLIAAAGAATASGQSAEILITRRLSASSGAAVAQGQAVIMLHRIDPGPTPEERIAAIKPTYRTIPILPFDRVYAII
jgi:hypothetical protein